VELLLCETFSCRPSELDEEDSIRITRLMTVMEQRAKARNLKYKKK